MSAPPQLIDGRYRVLGEAGRGGMGSVWRCEDERLGREVALKQVGVQPGESGPDRARALREARSLAALNHPNVVAVYDAFAVDDTLWLVMELVPGRSLAQVLREDGRLAPARAARIGAQVAEGLAAAHARGTVHRDVKPGNILVAADDRAKISDFGIARTAGGATLTGSGVLSGTPAYIAPEVAQGGEPLPAADVWALGATLFEAVEGRPPFDGDAHPMAVLTAIARQEPPTPQQAGELTEPIRRMLDRDPATRWSMTDAAHALRRVHDRLEPPHHTREQTSVGAAPSPQSPPTTPQPLKPRSPSAAATATPRRRRRGLLLAAGLVVLLVAAVAVLALFREQPDGTPTSDEPTGGSSSASDGAAGGSESSAASESSAGSASGGSGDVTTDGAGREQFVEDYYAALPADTEAGYALLSPSYQRSLSFEDYDGFWSRFDEVTVEATEPAGNAVDVTLLYDGGDEEVRRIHLTRDGDSWLITGDEVVG